MDGAAVWAGAVCIGRVVERGKGFGQIVHDALQLCFSSRHHMATFGAIPLEGIDVTFRAAALDDGAQTAGFWALGGVAHKSWEQKDVALFQVHAFKLAAIGDQQRRIAFDLMKKLFVGVDMKIGPLIGATHHGTNEVRVLPDLLVANGRLELVFVGIDPVLKIDGCAVVGGGGDIARC